MVSRWLELNGYLVAVAVLLAAPACAALDWLAEPACPCPPARAQLEPEAVPSGTGLPGPSAPGARQVAPVAPGAGQAGQGPDSRPSRGEVLARGAGRVGGLVTGNPLAWTIAGQIVAAGAAGLRRRRRVPTGQPAPG